MVETRLIPGFPGYRATSEGYSETWVLRIKGKPAELCLPMNDPFLETIKSAIPSLELLLVEKDLKWKKN